MNSNMDYGHTMAKSLILCDSSSNPNPKVLIFIEIMFDKWKTWARNSRYQNMSADYCSADKSAKNTQKISAQIVCPSPKVSNF